MADLTDREMLQQVLSLVDAAKVLPAAAVLDSLAATAPSVSVQQLPGSRWAERYIDGSGTREQPFAVYVRVASVDTSGRLDAASALMALADHFETATFPAPITALSGEDTPALVERSDNGTEVWRAAFVLESVRR